MANKIVLKTTDKSSRAWTLDGTYSLYLKEDPLWKEMQQVARRRIEKHSASPEEIEQLLDMLGLTA